ncbi:MAG: glycosyltransferase, partial [Blastocatellia bacterium]|nr:glycosyltransferase [Blastocatellia bacterium]
MKIFSLAKKIFSRDSWRSRRVRIIHDRRDKREAESWKKWLEKNQITDAAREQVRREIAGFSAKPLISIVTPVYNIEEKWLRRCIESVLGQIYENWELCLADDCSPLLHVKNILNEYAAKDKRIKIVFRETNGHISAASNSALQLATGDFCAFLDHDDELAPHALFELATAIVDNPSARIIYSDEDKIDELGRRFEPALKPDWSRDFFYSANYVNHLTAVHTSLIRD